MGLLLLFTFSWRNWVLKYEGSRFIFWTGWSCAGSEISSIPLVLIWLRLENLWFRYDLALLFLPSVTIMWMCLACSGSDCLKKKKNLHPSFFQVRASILFCCNEDFVQYVISYSVFFDNVFCLNWIIFKAAPCFVFTATNKMVATGSIVFVNRSVQLALWWGAKNFVLRQLRTRSEGVQYYLIFSINDRSI